jgi:hypothetical protein
MKRIINLAGCVGFLLAAVSGVRGQTPPPAKLPVYILVTADLGDYINWEMTQEKLRRTISALEKYQKNSSGLNSTVYFSGAMSDALEQHNFQDHLLDLVRASIGKGLIRPAYDGADEPTYEHRPMTDFSKAKSVEDRWLVRMDLAKALLTEARNPMTGTPELGKNGGLKRMQEVFGQPVIVRGVALQIPNLYGPITEVGSDAEIVNTLRRMSPETIMVGLPDADLGHSAGSQFRPWANVFSGLISPSSDTSPEMYWQEDVLRISEASLLDARTFRAEDGVEKLKAVLGSLDRGRVRVLHVELGGQRIYVKPAVAPMPKIVMPLAWAYDHPDSPLFPANLRFSAAEVDAHYSNQDDVLKFLTSEYLPAHPDIRIVSPSDLKSMAAPGWGYDLSVKDLSTTMRDLLKTWGDKPTPPPFVRVDEHYLSLADLFEVLSDSLAQLGTTGKLPVSVRVRRVFGPVSTAEPVVPVTGEVTAKSVALACNKLMASLRDDSPHPIPLNAIPSPIAIDGLSVTPAQFLRLMAEALVAPSATQNLQVKPVQMFAGRIMTFNNRRPRTDLGAPWTYKPAVLGTPTSHR